MHIAILHLDQMHHAEVHAANLRGIIIDQSHRPFRESSAEPQFLRDLTPHGAVINRLVEMRHTLVGVVDMPADADRCFCHEPLLPRLRATRVVQDFSTVQEHRIRNDLLQRGIVLRRRTRNEEIVLRLQKPRQVAVHLRAQSLETPQRIEKLPLHHQHLLVIFSHGSKRSLSRPAPQGEKPRRPDFSSPCMHPPVSGTKAPMTDELAQAVKSGKFTQKTADKLARLAPGSFCSHKSWGFGRVAEWNLIAGQILIDFGPKKNHPMQAEYAAETLSPIPAEHILALRETDPAGLKERCASDPLGVVRQVIGDLGGKATADQIASALTPSPLDAAAFKRWWDAARKKMKTDGHFKLPAKRTDPFVLLEAPVNAGEGLVNAFKESRHTKDQLLALDQISKSLDDLAGQEAALQEAIDRIHDISQKLRRMSPAASIEMLAVRDEILERFSSLKKSDDAPTIAEILTAESAKLTEIFANLPGARQRDVLEHFEAAFGDSWPDRALRLLREAGARLIADVCRLFEKHGRKEEFQSTLERWISDRSISSEMLIWLCKERNKRFPDLFNAELLAAVFSALEADMLAEKRTSRLKDLLMDDRELVGDLLVSASRDVVRDSMRKLLLTPVFDDLSKRSLMARIVKLYPETQNMITGAQAEEGDTSLTVSWPSMEKRKAEFDHLVAKEIPQNLRDINIAKEQGDLRENAGFKAAKEYQRVLQRRRVEMERDLARARGTDFENPNTSQVSIGTVVTVRHADGSAETFAILGAWDSAPEHGIVSYKAGIGQALLGAPVGAAVELPDENGARKATVESIHAFTDFDLLKKIHAIAETPAAME